MDTRTETVSVNNLLKQTGTVYRIIWQLPFTISASSFISPASKYWGTCSEENSNNKHAGKENEHTHAVQPIMI